MHPLFDELHLQNFLSHADTRLQLANRGLVLIAGEVVGNAAASSNGAGKTALLPDSLLFALFGKTLRGAFGPKVVKRDVGQDCLVELTGFDRGGTRYHIERPQKHRKKSKSKISFGAEKYDGDAAVDEKVRMLLGGFSFDSVVTAIIFGRGDAKFFTQLTDKDRKKILDELMSFGDLNRFLESAKAAVDRLGEEETARAREMEVVKARVETLEQQLPALASRASTFEEERRQEVQLCDDLMAQDRTWVTKKQRALKVLQTALADARADAESAQVASNKGDEEVQELRAAISSHDRTSAVTEEKVRGAEAETAKIMRKIAAAQSMTGTKCTSCQQEVGEYHTKAVVRELEAQLPTTTLAGLQAKLKAAKPIRAELAEGLEDAKGRWLAARAESDTAATNVRDAERVAHDVEVEIATREQRITTTKGEKERAKARTNAAAEQAKEMEQKIDEHRAACKRLEGDCVDHADRLLYYKFWVSAFGNAGIKSRLLDGVTPRLNESSSRWSEFMTDGLMRVTFSSDRELAKGGRKDEFTVGVDIASAAPSYDLASDGQRRRADIIAMMSLGDVAATRIGVPINLAVMDEIFDGLDAAGMERAVQMLQNLTSERSSIFVTTHSDNMASYFPTVLTVRHERGTSCIVT